MPSAHNISWSTQREKKFFFSFRLYPFRLIETAWQPKHWNPNWKSVHYQHIRTSNSSCPLPLGTLPDIPSRFLWTSIRKLTNMHSFSIIVCTRTEGRFGKLRYVVWVYWLSLESSLHRTVWKKPIRSFGSIQRTPAKQMSTVTCWIFDDPLVIFR